jgi:hypothetical protein
MIALFGKETDYGYLLQANVIETLICGLLTCAQNKRYILGTNSEIRKSLQRDKRIWRNINRQHYIYINKKNNRSDYAAITKDNKPLEFETDKELENGHRLIES